MTNRGASPLGFTHTRARAPVAWLARDRSLASAPGGYRTVARNFLKSASAAAIVFAGPVILT